MRKLVLAAAIGALLAGCGETAPSPKEQQTKIRNRPHEELAALPDDLRRVGLVRAIRATGHRCPKRVEPNPVHQGDYRGMALWTARCDNNEQYAIFIGANEDVQVSNCRDMGRHGLPACRALPPAAPERERPKARPGVGR